MNTTEEKRESIPNSVNRMLFAGIGVILQVAWICWLAIKLNERVQELRGVRRKISVLERELGL